MSAAAGGQAARMPLTAGTRLGAYEIIAPLGAGGMGEVYSARDTRLDRIVAIKVLPPSLAADPQFRDRFEREARSISALSHPNICTLYDVGRQDDMAFLVMEHVAGETLAVRLERGPMSVEEALRTAAQVADSLDHAHRSGILHRDLKPGNIMLSRGGAKLLDFGLAKAIAGPATAARPAQAAGFRDLVAAATVTTPAQLTQAGAILGTFQYMAPELVEGREADARSDVWAFGCVLYEMLTGRRAFEGTSAAGLIAAILERQPAPLDRVGPPLQPALQRLIDACLEKQLDDRFQSMRDVRREIEWLPLRHAAPAPANRPSRRAAWTAGAALIPVAAGALGAWLMLPRSVAPHLPVVFNVTVPPHDATFGRASTESVLTYPAPAVSPDGRRVAFVAYGQAGHSIFIRPLDSTQVQAVKGTSGARNLFWSPDGDAIGFFGGGKLRTIDLPTGKVEILADAPSGFGGSWGPDGTILFSPDERSPLYRISAQGGTPAAVTTLDASRGDQAHRWPQWLPDGRHFVFMPWTDSTTTRQIQLASLDGGASRTLFQSKSAAIAARDYFFYATDMPPQLSAQAYNPKTLELVGPPFAALGDTNVDFDWVSGSPSASVAGDTLVYTTGKYRTSVLAWVDRNGRAIETLGEPGVHFDPTLSPDGRMLALERNDPTAGAGDVWTIDLGRRAFSRLSSAPGFETTPVWSPDSTRVVYASDQDKAPALFIKPANGADVDRLLVTPKARSFPTGWSPDGRQVIFMLNGGPTRTDIWTYDMERRIAVPLLETPFNEGWASFSPDGHWIAYVSDEDQQRQVYVRSYPDRGVKTQISNTGGGTPQWRGDGREMFYLAPDNTMMSVSLQVSAGRIIASPPVPLFTAKVDQNKTIRNQFAATADGQRFLILSAIDVDASPLVGVLNWRSLLGR